MGKYAHWLSCKDSYLSIKTGNNGKLLVTRLIQTLIFTFGQSQASNFPLAFGCYAKLTVSQVELHIKASQASDYQACPHIFQDMKSILENIMIFSISLSL